MKRRDFTGKAVLAGMAFPMALKGMTMEHSGKKAEIVQHVPLGLDAHSVSAMQWNDKELISYAAELKMNALLFNGLNYFESLEDKHLINLKKMLDKERIKLYFGVGGLSVNSPSFNPNFGNPKKLIQQGIRVAKIFGTSSVNCKIGNIADRYTDGGIVARMDEIIRELSAMRSQIRDAGLKFAVENHAGDMRSEEVLQIVETVGTDICGVMLDPGNSVWAMEDPMHHIEKLGKHALCTSVRDYRIWESENGATFQWTALGEGSMDLQKYTQLMTKLCPGVPLNIETVSNRQNEIPFLKKDFWDGYPDLRAADLLDFYRMIRKGKSIEVVKPAAGEEENTFQQNLQKAELKRSIDYLRQHCSLIKSPNN